MTDINDVVDRVGVFLEIGTGDGYPKKKPLLFALDEDGKSVEIFPDDLRAMIDFIEAMELENLEYSKENETLYQDMGKMKKVISRMSDKLEKISSSINNDVVKINNMAVSLRRNSA